jgi:hypothetical protein
MADKSNIFQKVANKMLGNFKKEEVIQLQPTEEVHTAEIITQTNRELKMDFLGSVGGGGTYRTLFTHTFNGEKDDGEIGPIKIYKIDYDAVRYRSWQAYLESEICQMVIKN